MFERYTEQARRTLFFARYEAFQAGSAFLETEHLLLGLFRDDESPAARVFSRARLLLEEVRREIEAHTARRVRTPLSSSDHVPFSEETKRALQYAAQEADRLLHGHIGTEHLLLGLFREEQGLATQILTGRGLRLATVRDEIVQMSGTAPDRLAGLPFGLSLPSHASRLLRVSRSRREPHLEGLVTISPQRVNADGFTLKDLIAWAYRADLRYVDVPADLDSRERYDAQLELPGPQSWPTIDRLIRDGINSHFSLVVTHETKTIEVFVLSAVDGQSPGRRRHDENEDFGGATTYAGFSTVDFDVISEPSSRDSPDWRKRLHSVGPILLTATTMEEFAQWLEDFVGHPVIDETGLTGTYHIEVQREMQGLDELRQALITQLALALNRAQREMPTLVVRRVM
jgi:uncharacterized protein (TIGR03435 family)